jgi:Mannosyltransferase (PIG-V)
VSRAPAPAGPAATGAGWSGVRRDLAAALPGWVVARVIVLAALVVAHVIAAKVDSRLPEYSDRLGRGLLAWDGRWYLEIARDGYSALESLRFFPLYPLLGRALSPLFAGHTGAALLAISNLAALALGALVHRLCLMETDDADLARRAAWLVALVPPFFVMVMGYSEPIALTLAVWCFLCLRRRSWGWAAIAGLLAGFVRPVGILLVVPAAIEAARGFGAAPARERVRRALAVASPVAGTAPFLAWVAVRFDDALLPFRVQNWSHLRGGFSDPVSTFVRSTARLLDGELGTNGIHLPWVVVVVALTVVACRRWPAAYGAFAAVSVLVALCARNWGSFERYGFGAFPVVLALASLTTRPWAERATLAVCAAGMACYATVGLLLYYVP